MAFSTAITGLKASTTELDVTGNNIANASTVGFKAGRTEFADIFSTVVVGSGSANSPGSGVIVSDIAQDFTAGTIQFTNNNLDLAIDGSGFFQLNNGQGGITYTRAGGFELDKDGNVVSKNGNFLQGFGLDAAGNMQPIGNLAVNQKESPPSATSVMGLSFNIDSRADAEDLIRPYDPTDSASYTFSTTNRTFDSLGNENTIKFDFIEQPAVRERQVVSFSNLPANADGMTVDVAGATLTLSNTTTQFVLTGGASGPKTDYSGANDLSFDVVTGANGTETVTLNAAYGDHNAMAAAMTLQLADTTVTHNGTGFVFTSNTPGPDNITINNYAGTAAATGPTDIGIPAGTTGISGNSTQATISASIAAQLGAVRTSDPRIETLRVDPATGGLQVTYAASATDVHDILISGPSTSTNDITADEDFAAREVQSFGVAAPGVDGFITIGSGTGAVQIATNATDTDRDLVDRILANQVSIISSNPEIDSLSADLTTTPLRVLINYRPELGDVVNIPLSESTSTSLGGATLASQDEVGDNSYEGVYQMYAYLNGTELLDIGRVVQPGAPGHTTSPQTTEPGALLVTFDTTNGVLQTVNGSSVGGSGAAPKITILNADPADPLNEIELDISGSTQFASESIVKASTQNGFTKGDLIGVTFAPDGTMVASFSNGQNSNLGVVAMATFENQGGLQPVGDTSWSATLSSGQAIVNPPGTGLNGSLRSAALEQSNVNLSEQLVKLIEAQRNFQANSKTLQTENAITQNILQIS